MSPELLPGDAPVRGAARAREAQEPFVRIRSPVATWIRGGESVVSLAGELRRTTVGGHGPDYQRAGGQEKRGRVRAANAPADGDAPLEEPQKKSHPRRQPGEGEQWED